MSHAVITASSLSLCAHAPAPPPVGRRKRGRAGSLTGRSRNRALRLGIAVAPSASHIATLTYPGAFPMPEQVKRDLDNLGKRFRDEYPGGWIVWRLEPTPSGRPHFHALIGGVDGSCPDWFFRSWARITGAGPNAIPGILTDVQTIDPARPKHWARYIGKEEPQRPEGDNFWSRAGKRTGTIGRANLPAAAQAKEQISTTPGRIARVLDFLERAWVPLAWDEREAAARRALIRKARLQRGGLFLDLPEGIKAHVAAILRGEEHQAEALPVEVMSVDFQEQHAAARHHHAQDRTRRPHGSAKSQPRPALWHPEYQGVPRQQRSGPQPRHLVRGSPGHGPPRYVQWWSMRP